MNLLIITALLLPLFGFVFLMATSSIISRRFTNAVGCFTVLLSFICFSALTWQYLQSSMPITLSIYSWIPIEKINATLALQVDSLSLLMSLIITGVGFLIHVYSIGYIEHETDYARYFACLNFFVFAMLLLVLAQDLLVLFVGWEGVGLASYLLIGYWYDRPAASRAATKAFVVNRVGDLGFLLGLLLIFRTFGTADILAITEQAKTVSDPSTISMICLLLFFGCAGKSAQLPLQVWLPDAMEGPTPVSALIHAATMVTAGVYLIVRMHELFLEAPTVLYFIGIVGGVTALYAALSGMAQIDLKRVLAYSTISQLGLMFLACGIGAFYAAMFHLTTHAFIKALLFLSAGNVIHMMHGTTDMNKMGGLAKKFGMTHWLFLIGVLALSGIPPLAAFFSKDLILELSHSSHTTILYYLGMGTTLLTGFYLMRAYCLTFAGHSLLVDKVYAAIHEAPKVMITPLLFLSVLSICGGFLGFMFHNEAPLEVFLNKVGIVSDRQATTLPHLITPVTILSTVLALLGIITAIVLYTYFRERLGSTIVFLRKAFYIDALYALLFVKPSEKFAHFLDQWFEVSIINSSLRRTVTGTNQLSAQMQRMQSGQIRSYIAWMTIGVVLLIGYFVFKI